MLIISILLIFIQLIRRRLVQILIMRVCIILILKSRTLSRLLRRSALRSNWYILIDLRAYCFILLRQIQGERINLPLQPLYHFPVWIGVTQ